MIDNTWVGKIVGNAEIRGTLGEGAMGGVYKGYLLSLDIEVAVKIIKSEFAQDENLIARFEREAKTAAKLHHTNIVRVFDFGRVEDVYYIVMEYVEGRNVDELIKGIEDHRLPVENALEMAISMCQALDEAHKYQVIHRDIKPANILLKNDGVYKLADLGLAKQVDDTRPEKTQGIASESSLPPRGYDVTQVNEVFGSPLYMSPEQSVNAQACDIRSDIYSLGVTLYHVISGGAPFTGDSLAEIYEKHNKASLPSIQNCPQLRPEFFAIIKKSMAKKPKNRYQTPKDMLGELEYIKAVYYGSSVGLPQRRNIKDRVIVGSAFAGAVIVVGAIGILLWQRNKEKAGNKRLLIVEPDNNESIAMSPDQKVFHDTKKRFNDLTTTLADEDLQKYSSTLWSSAKVDAYDADRLNNQGKVIEAAAKYDNAILSLQKAIDIAERELDLIKQKAQDKITREYMKAQKFFEASQGSYAQKDYDSSLQGIEKALEIFPEFAEAQQLHDAIKSKLKKINTVVGQINLSIDRNHWKNAVDSLSELQQISNDSEVISQLSLRIKASSGDYYSEKAIELVDQKKLDEAQLVITEGLAFAPNSKKIEKVSERIKAEKIAIAQEEERVRKKKEEELRIKREKEAAALALKLETEKQKAQFKKVNSLLSSARKSFEMKKNSLAKDIVKQAIEILPDYVAAKDLLREIDERMALVNSKSTQIEDLLLTKNWDVAQEEINALSMLTDNTLLCESLRSRLVDLASNSYFDIATGYMDNNDFVSAEKFFNKVLEFTPDSDSVSRALKKLEAKKLEAVRLVELKKAEELRLQNEAEIREERLAESEKLLSEAGKLYYAKNNFKAHELLLKSIELSPGNIEVQQLLRQVESAIKTIEIELSSIREAIDNTVWAAALTKLKYVKLLDSSPELISSLEVELSNKASEFYYQQGREMLKRHKFDAAESSFKEVKKYKPTYEGIDNALQSVGVLRKKELLKQKKKKRSILSQSSLSVPHGNFQLEGLNMQFVFISSGNFIMGNSNGDVDEKPVHGVVLDEPFWIGAYEVTQSQYRAIMKSNPSRNKVDGNPVQKVSWFDAVTFCERLTEIEREAGRLKEGYSYQLPTEAQWEFAAIGASEKRQFVFSGSNEPQEVAWTKENSQRSVQAVGQKKPNKLGIYDMSGNVWEWCADYADRSDGKIVTSSYKAGVKNPVSIKGDRRIYRGGGYNSMDFQSRVTFRNSGKPKSRLSFIGFRVVLSPTF